MNSTYIGIDMGTSSVKLVLMDETGQVQAQSSVSYEVSHPFPGWAQIEPQIWYESMISGLRELMTGQDPKLVKRIGVTGQMHTLVVLDAEGNSIRPALMWNDKRTKDIIPVLREHLLQGEDGNYLSGIVSTGSPAAGLYWIKINEPERFRSIKHFLIGPDYLVYRLTGAFGTDFCEASTSSFFSLTEKRWLPQMQSLIGLEASAFPPVRSSTSVAGNVLPDIRELFGWPKDVSVIAGTGDNPASAVSTGCLGGGYPVLSLGTSGVLMISRNTFQNTGKGKVIQCSLHEGEYEYLTQGVVQSTGECIDWWTKKILGRQYYGKLTDKTDKSDETVPRLPDLLFYPHINGDKTLYADPDLRGAFLGLSVDTTPEEMFFAVMEGLCFAIKELSAAMQIHLVAPDALKVIGGGSKNDIWMQTLANILEVPIERMSGTTGPAYGIALLAKMAGSEKPLNTLVTDRYFYPDHQAIPFFREKYARYLRIHSCINDVYGR